MKMWMVKRNEEHSPSLSNYCLDAPKQLYFNTINKTYGLCVPNIKVILWLFLLGHQQLHHELHICGCECLNNLKSGLDIHVPLRTNPFGDPLSFHLASSGQSVQYFSFWNTYKANDIAISLNMQHFAWPSDIPNLLQCINNSPGDESSEPLPCCTLMCSRLLCSEVQKALIWKCIAVWWLL